MVHLFNRLIQLKQTNNAKSFIYNDHEFGDIKVRLNDGYHIKLSVNTSGQLIASLPKWSSTEELAKLIDSSRNELRQSLSRLRSRNEYSDGDKLGKFHHLVIRPGIRTGVKVSKSTVAVTASRDIDKDKLQQIIRDGVADALRQEAKLYLPRRLQYYAVKYGFNYKRVRLTHAKSRWGSCSSRGTISLNIALMTLPDKLIDYVLLHELNHTKHMDHSTEFWSDLEKICPNCKRRRQAMKLYSPYL